MAITKVTRNLLSTGIDDQSNATAITIDSSENVGIGTNDPSAKVDIQISNANGPYGASSVNLNVENTNTSVTEGGWITVSGYTGNTANSGQFTMGGISGGKQTTAADGDYGGYLSLWTTSGGANGEANSGVYERMRINSAGDVIVGNTSPYSVTKMTVDFPSESRFGFTLRDTGSAGTTRMITFVKSGSVVGSIDSTTSATAYNTSSDYRLKENVEYDWDATTRLKQLRPSRFNFIVDPDTTVDGFLAHEVEDIVPEAITGVKDEMQEEEYEVTPAVLDENGNVVTEAVMGTREVPKYQGIDQAKLVPLLTKALQEQQTIIEDLQARIETLENA